MKTLLFFLSILIFSFSYAQNKKVYQDLNLLVAETQRAVSIKKGQKIDTAHYRTLFLPTAQFTVVGKEDGKALHETMNLDAFLASLTDEYYSNGYFETGTGKIVEQYGGIAQVIQGFYGEDSEGEKGWGVNSYQLIYSNDRWWVANMVWTMSENEGKDIPKKYRKN
jgi:hypothetical protein